MNESKKLLYFLVFIIIISVVFFYMFRPIMIVEGHGGPRMGHGFGRGWGGKYWIGSNSGSYGTNPMYLDYNYYNPYYYYPIKHQYTCPMSYF